ncbi:MAG: hypothetical protein ACI4S2_02230, partial [Lachnospiraceae bacterium]
SLLNSSLLSFSHSGIQYNYLRIIALRSAGTQVFILEQTFIKTFISTFNSLKTGKIRRIKVEINEKKSYNRSNDDI